MRPDLAAVAGAYRDHRRGGAAEAAAYHAAVAAYAALHPDSDLHHAREETSRLIFEASEQHPEWLWDGVGSGPRPRWY